MLNKISFYFYCLLVLWMGIIKLYSQPINDQCVNHLPIDIPSSGFSLGIFYSDTINLTGATIQTGEYFHPVHISAGTDKKSVWYSFYLPTARAVDLKLMQPRNDLPEDAVGFTVYYASSCLPGAAQIPPAKLTPLNKFGSTYNPCLLPGHYLVQVSSKLNANDSIFLKLTLDYPQVLNQFDRPSTAQNLGTISGGWHTYTFDVGCQTIENNGEVCPALGSNYLDYKQTTWHVFTTDNFVDLIRFEISEAYGKYTGNLKVGINLYKGDVRTTPMSSLVLIDGCKVLQPTGQYYGDPYYAGVSWLCELEPNTTYSIQIFYHKDYSNTVRIRLYERGSGMTKSPNPSNIHPTNELGILPGSPGGSWTYGTDVLACNAFIRDNVCGTVNPPSGQISWGGQTYVLSTWYKFTILEDANVRFVIDGNLGKILYQGDVELNCNLSPFWQFTGGDVTYNCLPAGTYSLQILGKLDTVSNVTSYYYNNLGMSANVSIGVYEVDIYTQFQLTDTGEVDSVNHWNPLPNNVYVYSTEAYFSCQNTVLPANGVCHNWNLTSKKAVYRTIYIDRYGILTIGGYTPYLLHKLYRGDASALATAQGAFSYGEYINGLVEMFGCTDFYYSVSVCVEPGVYTLVTFGDSTDVGRSSRPWVMFREVVTQFSNPSSPNNLGDITSSLQNGTVIGTVDYFSCINNPMTIDGRNPCYTDAKQIYREFYINEPMLLNISTTSGLFRLFYGRLSTGGPVSANIPGVGDLGCRSSFNNQCTFFPPGWYTVVSYGYGGSYTGPTYSGGLIGATNNISLWLTNLPNPKYNRPNKAYYAGITDYGPNSGTPTYPNMSRVYTFGTEWMNCRADTPFSTHPIDPCPTGFNRVAYFVFRLTKESFVSIMDVPSSMPLRLYSLDVRVDSQLMPTSPPIQPCIYRTNIDHYERTWWTWYGKVDFCRLQPGYYTLVVFGNNSHIGTSFTPRIYVDSIYESRFDRALRAYDFDLIPGDSVWYFGKIGDVNPLNPARSPSDDFISCLTGAASSDPGLSDPQNLCWNGLYPYGNNSPSILYPIDQNEAAYYGLSTTNVPIRRNLWYTFVVNGPGRVYVRVRNRTPNKSNPVLPFTVYLSDVDGNIPFSSLASMGMLDSTYAQGLTYVINNSTFDWYGCAGNLETVNFTISPCEPLRKRRYFIVVDEHAGMMVSNQVDVSVKFDRVPIVPLRYDKFVDANVINGLNQVMPPYTPVALGAGQFRGDTGYFACATKAPTDQNTCGTRTLWYKFTSSISGKIRINYTIDGITTTFNPQDVMLFKEIIPNDSTSAGLQQVPLTSINVGGTLWGEGCLNPATYYIMLTGCSYTIENVVPKIWLIGQSGDMCIDPISMVLNGPGSVSSSVVIDCHSIGESFGENGSSMGCLFGPSGYKSTWFKVDLNFNIKVNLSFQLSENTTALPNQIRYRILYGSCNAMTAGPCNSDALTEFTLHCMETNGMSYYVQVVTPINATGSLSLTVRADSTPNQSCQPFNPFRPVANFTVINGCAGDSICFVNQSTQGDSIRYFWDFGDPFTQADTSHAVNPCWLYPIPSTPDTVQYNVMLIVTNLVSGLSDTVIIPVPVYPLPSAFITRQPPQNGFYVSGNVPINFFSNTSNVISAPPTIWFWDFDNGITSNQPNPTGIIYGPNDEGLNVVTLYVINGSCTLVVKDSLYVRLESIYVGGFYDGSDHFVLNASCPMNAIWRGGPYDGSDVIIANAICNPNPLWRGGPYDGTDRVFLAANCIPNSVWLGGPYDGTDRFFLAATCVPNSVWRGGPYDGSDVVLAVANCPPNSLWRGGNYDGSDHILLPANCPIAPVYKGGFYDGASFYSFSGCSPLPVEYLSLKAFWQGADGVLEWVTATETNNAGFIVEKLVNNWFTEVGFVPGSGTHVGQRVYQWFDYDLAYQPNDIFIYRLKQIDYDGNFTMSDVVYLTKDDLSYTNNDILFARLYPNPAYCNSNIRLIISSLYDLNVNLFVVDFYGNKLYQFINLIKKGVNIIEIPVVNLQPAMYHLIVQYQDKMIVIPFEVVK
ncbi:MAG: hypothetical protein N2Z72_08860 [Bacteroidales bacterium]|nr:hypothetical protein [Bacteroidales bacterium]